MIFCHVFWLTEINGQGFNDAQLNLTGTMANRNINVNHFREIRTNDMTKMMSMLWTKISQLIYFLDKNLSFWELVNRR